MTESMKLPVLPVKNLVIIPAAVTSVYVGRSKSLAAIRHAIEKRSKLLVVSQKKQEVEDPSEKDLYRVGTIVNIVQMIKFPKQDTVNVMVEGEARGRIINISAEDGILQAEVEQIITQPPASRVEEKRLQVQMKALFRLYESYGQLSQRISPEILKQIQKTDDLERIADTLSQFVNIDNPQKQKYLEEVKLFRRFEMLIEFLHKEITILGAEKKIRSRMLDQIEKTQREYYLQEKARAIQQELGGEDESEYAAIMHKLDSLKMPDETREQIIHDLQKLQTMNPSSTEANVLSTYANWVINLPWQNLRRLNIDMDKATKILEDRHYGLKQVKDRILDYIAVQKKIDAEKKQKRGAILCFVGPPGVGKSSLGKSIAKATGRDFLNISLGGIRDEAEIRGHRRTYIGALPGRIIQQLKNVKYGNVVMVLDEIDKLTQNYHQGDPASALLQALDPEQNDSFSDHYLGVDYDLSQIMFICTANTLDIPAPLLDRMEIIRLPGYVDSEKFNIAKQHLIKRQRKLHALKSTEIVIKDSAIREIITSYTREAGVRNLERGIARLCRKAARLIVEQKTKKVVIGKDNLKEFAGVRKYTREDLEKDDKVGIATGLAWTEYGGEVLLVEVVTMRGKGKITITGQLGSVMQESVQAAVAYIKSRASLLGVDPRKLGTQDIHVHVPAGAVPKDGPSAGIAILSAVVSALTNVPVRRGVAMTGEISLRGRVLAIGGLKEKITAAVREKIKTVLIPKENEKDLEDIPEHIKENLDIRTVEQASEVLQQALNKDPSEVPTDILKPEIPASRVVQ